MTKIQIDDEVFAHLQANAVPLVDTPNATIRRLLGMDRQPEGLPSASGDAPTRSRQPGRKQVSASLPTLVGTGALEQGETLRLVNYRGEAVPGSDAVIRGSELVWNGQPYSMSRLARILLTRQGYVSTDVRGPRHWVTAAGTSVLALWEEYLEDQSDLRALREREGEASVPFDDVMRDLSTHGLI